MSLVNPTISPSDPSLEISRGNIAHVTQDRKFGRNADIGATEDIWTVGGLYPFPQVALPLRIQAGGNAADDIAGANAREITIVGLLDDFSEESETLDTAGIAASVDTVNSYRRLHRAFVTDVGQYGVTNLADINIETTTGVVLGRINAGLGQTQLAILTVPVDKTMRLGTLHFHPESNKTVDITVFQRQNADVIVAPMTGIRVVSAFNGVMDSFEFEYHDAPFPEKTDFWVRASNPSAATALSVEFHYRFVTNGF